MNEDKEEKEFLESHPSLKGKISMTDGYGNGIDNEKGYAYEVDLEDIHATQLDKQKVKEAIEPLYSELKKHAQGNGTITISPPMVQIILARLKELSDGIC